MKFKFMLIGIALALVLCISPVAAVSGNDFGIENDESGDYESYTYHNVNDPNEKYTKIYTGGTRWLNSIVTFKPANIPDAPRIGVDTNKRACIYLPQSVDEWEIKYYSRFFFTPRLDDKYLKNAGIVNLNEFLEGCTSSELILELSWGQFISQKFDPQHRYNIPDVD